MSISVTTPTSRCAGREHRVACFPSASDTSRTTTLMPAKEEGSFQSRAVGTDDCGIAHWLDTAGFADSRR